MKESLNLYGDLTEILAKKFQLLSAGIQTDVNDLSFYLPHHPTWADRNHSYA